MEYLRETAEKKSARTKNKRSVLARSLLEKLSESFDLLGDHISDFLEDLRSKSSSDISLAPLIGYLEKELQQNFSFLQGQDREMMSSQSVEILTLYQIAPYVKTIVDRRAVSWRDCLYVFIMTVYLKTMSNREERKCICRKIFSDYSADDLMLILDDYTIPDVVSLTIYDSIQDYLFIQIFCRIYFLSKNDDFYSRHLDTFFSDAFMNVRYKQMSAVMNHYYEEHPDDTDALNRLYLLNVQKNPSPKQFVSELTTSMLMIFSSDPFIRSHYHPAYFIKRDKLLELVTLIEKRYEKEEKDKEGIMDSFYNSHLRDYRERFFSESFLSEECYERYENCLDEYESDRENIWDFVKGFIQGFLDSINIVAMWETLKSLKSFVKSLADFDLSAIGANIIASLKGMVTFQGWYELGKSLGGMITSVIGLFISGPFVLIAKSMKLIKKVKKIMPGFGKRISGSGARKTTEAYKKELGESHSKDKKNKEVEEQVKAEAQRDITPEEANMQQEMNRMKTQSDKALAEKQKSVDEIFKKMEQDKADLLDFNEIESAIEADLKASKRAIKKAEKEIKGKTEKTSKADAENQKKIEEAIARREGLEAQLKDLKARRRETFDSYESKKKEFNKASRDLDKEYDGFLQDRADLKDNIGDQKYIEDLCNANRLRKAEMLDETFFNPVQFGRNRLSETASKVIGIMFAPVDVAKSLADKAFYWSRKTGVDRGFQWITHRIKKDSGPVVTNKTRFALDERIRSRKEAKNASETPKEMTRIATVEDYNRLDDMIKAVRKAKKWEKIKPYGDFFKDYVLSAYDSIEKSIFSDFSASRSSDMIYLMLNSDCYEQIVETKSLFDFIIDPDNVPRNVDGYKRLLTFITSSDFESGNEQMKKSSLMKFLKLYKTALLPIFETPTLDDTIEDILKYMEAYKVNMEYREKTA